jgi:hypothetical protein
MKPRVVDSCAVTGEEESSTARRQVVTASNMRRMNDLEFEFGFRSVAARWPGDGPESMYSESMDS